MSTLITGSKAIHHWLGDSFWRKTNDTDYIGRVVEEMSIDFRLYKTTIPSFLYTDKKHLNEFFSVDLCPPLQKLIERNKDATYMDLTSILIMKNAHKHFYLGQYSKSFKHLTDYSQLLKFVTLNDEDKKLSAEYKEWLIDFAYYRNPRLLYLPKLNKTKQQFFNDSVKYFVDHDWIHELVAIEDKPAYTKCLKGEVMFSSKLFNELDYASKVNMVLEESFVLALERCIVPFLKGEQQLPAVTPNEAFKYALTRVATNITSGSFRDFAADNFSDIFKIYTKNHSQYYKPIQQILEAI